MIGTEAIRARLAHTARTRCALRAGRPLRFPRVDASTPVAAGIVTERVWACVKLQWAWLGGAVEAEPAPVRETVHAA